MTEHVRLCVYTYVCLHACTHNVYMSLCMYALIDDAFIIPWWNGLEALAGSWFYSNLAGFEVSVYHYFFQSMYMFCYTHAINQEAASTPSNQAPAFGSRHSSLCALPLYACVLKCVHICMCVDVKSACLVEQSKCKSKMTNVKRNRDNVACNLNLEILK